MNMVRKNDRTPKLVYDTKPLRKMIMP